MPSPSGNPIGAAAMATARPLRLGIFGGAFDPPHLAHVALAQCAVAQLALDKLLIIPTGQARHKNRPLSAAQHRVAMCQLAFSGLANMQLDPREIHRQGPSFTVDTLNELQQTQSPCELFLIIGGDQARALTTWHQWAVVLKNATICIADRAIAGTTDAQFDWQSLPQARTAWLSLPLSPVSATDIRQRVSRAEAVQALVGDAVARYIADHHLYTDIYTD